MSTGCLQDPAAGRPMDQMMGRSRDVHGKSVKHAFFKIQLTNTSNFFDRLLKTL